MTEKEALKILSNDIWKGGEYRDAIGCLVPTKYSWTQRKRPFNEVSDFLEKKYGATHFSRFWKDKGKIVTIELYKCKAFGATCDIGKKIKTIDIKI